VQPVVPVPGFEIFNNNNNNNNNNYTTVLSRVPPLFIDDSYKDQRPVIITAAHSVNFYNNINGVVASTLGVTGKTTMLKRFFSYAKVACTSAVAVIIATTLAMLMAFDTMLALFMVAYVVWIVARGWRTDANETKGWLLIALVLIAEHANVLSRVQPLFTDDSYKDHRPVIITAALSANNYNYITEAPSANFDNNINFKRFFFNPTHGIDLFAEHDNGVLNDVSAPAPPGTTNVSSGPPGGSFLVQSSEEDDDPPPDDPHRVLERGPAPDSLLHELSLTHATHIDDGGGGGDGNGTGPISNSTSRGAFPCLPHVSANTTHLRGNDTSLVKEFTALWASYSPSPSISPNTTHGHVPYASLDTWAATHGMAVNSTTDANGNCFFSAILHTTAYLGLFPTDHTATSEAQIVQDLRMNIVNHLRLNLDTLPSRSSYQTFRELIQMEITSTSPWRSVPEFLTSMETDGTWAELPVILAAAAFLQLPIQIVSSTGTGDAVRVDTYGDAAPGAPAIIVFNENNRHFLGAGPLHMTWPMYTAAYPFAPDEPRMNATATLQTMAAHEEASAAADNVLRLRGGGGKDSDSDSNFDSAINITALSSGDERLPTGGPPVPDEMKAAIARAEAADADVASNGSAYVPNNSNATGSGSNESSPLSSSASDDDWTGRGMCPAVRRGFNEGLCYEQQRHGAKVKWNAGKYGHPRDRLPPALMQGLAQVKKCKPALCSSNSDVYFTQMLCLAAGPTADAADDGAGDTGASNGTISMTNVTTMLADASTLKGWASHAEGAGIASTSQLQHAKSYGFLIDALSTTPAGCLLPRHAHKDWKTACNKTQKGLRRDAAVFKRREREKYSRNVNDKITGRESLGKLAARTQSSITALRQYIEIKSGPFMDNWGRLNRSAPEYAALHDAVQRSRRFTNAIEYSPVMDGLRRQTEYGMKFMPKLEGRAAALEAAALEAADAANDHMNHVSVATEEISILVELSVAALATQGVFLANGVTKKNTFCEWVLQHVQSAIFAAAFSCNANGRIGFIAGLTCKELKKAATGQNVPAMVTKRATGKHSQLRGIMTIAGLTEQGLLNGWITIATNLNRVASDTNPAKGYQTLSKANAMQQSFVWAYSKCGGGHQLRPCSMATESASNRTEATTKASVLVAHGNKRSGWSTGGTGGGITAVRHSQATELLNSAVFKAATRTEQAAMCAQIGHTLTVAEEVRQHSPQSLTFHMHLTSLSVSLSSHYSLRATLTTPTKPSVGLRLLTWLCTSSSQTLKTHEAPRAAAAAEAAVGGALGEAAEEAAEEAAAQAVPASGMLGISSSGWFAQAVLRVLRVVLAMETTMTTGAVRGTTDHSMVTSLPQTPVTRTSTSHETRAAGDATAGGAVVSVVRVVVDAEVLMGTRALTPVTRTSIFTSQPRQTRTRVTSSSSHTTPLGMLLRSRGSSSTRLA
jgi:hypothetical protein